MVFIGGSFKGAKAPCRKMGTYKAKPYYQGGWEKYNKINNSRIIGQSKIFGIMFITFFLWYVFKKEVQRC
jgi:hypothetical protein